MLRFYYIKQRAGEVLWLVGIILALVVAEKNIRSVAGNQM